jgi:hypothetical protein
MDTDMSQLHAQNAFVLKARKYTAYGFHSQSQIVGDIKAGHTEVKLIWGVTSRPQSSRKVEQEPGESSFRTLSPNQKQYIVQVGQVVSQQAIEFLSYRRVAAADFVKLICRKFTDRRCLKRRRCASMAVGGQPVESDQLPSKVKSDDLFVSIGHWFIDFD